MLTMKKRNIIVIDVPSTDACLECHGIWSKIIDGNFTYFHCHTGHAYSLDSLMSLLTEKIEDSLYSAIPGIDESILLLNHFRDPYAETNQVQLAAVYFTKAKEAKKGLTWCVERFITMNSCV
jgi:two-component system chemotaxis response regulator CheB